MQVRYLPALVMLIASAIGCILGIIKSYDIMYMLKMEIVIIIVFYFIGCLAKKLIIAILKENDEQNEELENIEESNE